LSRTITPARTAEEADADLRTMRTSYLNEQRALGVEFIGLATVSITDEILRRQAEFLAGRSATELAHDTGVWTRFATKSPYEDDLAMATEALTALATEQARRCVIDPAEAYDLAAAEQEGRSSIPSRVSA
jgi:hypothetical protein